MNALDVVARAKPLLDEIKAHAAAGRELARRRAELARVLEREQDGTKLSERIPVAAILQHEIFDLNATVFGLLPGEYDVANMHQIKEHGRDFHSANASLATKHGSST